ncbi:MAG: histidine--tRNA ligase [Candidatus Omnitrophica bacterium]|nr:histidine--tRNA ligase [Candidatus Omnitrophota bacterium]
MKQIIYKALRGTKDILPSETLLWQKLEEKARNIFSRYQYKEIRTPIIEEMKLFVRSVGETTDIVQKEMFSFKDRGGREICLRPEATASCVRAYLENNVDLSEPMAKFYYLGPMFRAERPQKGRLREFHQIGVEVLGAESYLVDAEVISLLVELLRDFGLESFLLKLNSLGCVLDKKAISERYREILFKKKERLCLLCQERLERNVLRILDCKEAKCRKVVTELPSTLELICTECKKHFQSLEEILSSLGIDYELEPRMVRGIDYYTRTVFELVSEALGSQDALAAGGRYDNLIESLGGPSRGAVGFALGMERVILALKKTGRLNWIEKSPEVFLITLGEEAGRVGFLLLENLRRKGISIDMDYTDKSLKAKMRRADRIKAKFVLIIGEEEIKRGEYLLRTMATGEQTFLKKETIIEDLLNRLVSNIK